MSVNIKIIECPRDAMQGMHDFIPTENKVRYLQSLLSVGFDVLDCGSFVSPRAIPQMKDTHQVLAALDLSNTPTKLSVIVANRKGAQYACAEEKVSILGVPFSISNQFQQYNSNCNQAEGFERVKNIKKIADSAGKETLVYLSMCFGNPYNEPWSVHMVEEWVAKFAEMGIRTINLSDTVGAAQLDDIAQLYSTLIPQFPEIEFGAHFHTPYLEWHAKIDTAFRNGCKRFDGAIQGFGGCPMSKSDLVGNMPTEKLITFLQEKKLNHSLNLLAFESAFNKALTLFNPH